MANNHNASLSSSSQQSSGENSPSPSLRRSRHHDAATDEFFHAYRFDDTLPLRLEIVDERREKGKNKKNVVYIVRVRTGPYADPAYADFNVQISTESLEQLARDLKTAGYVPLDKEAERRHTKKVLVTKGQQEKAASLDNPDQEIVTHANEGLSMVSDVEHVELTALHHHHHHHRHHSPGRDGAVCDAARQHWQEFLHSICRSLLASTSPYLRNLLFPRIHLTDWHALAMQHAAMVLQSEGLWSIEERLPGVGWRLAKHYALVRPVGTSNPMPDTRLMMSWAFVGRKYAHAEVKERQEALKALVRLQHPLLWPVTYETFHEAGCLVMHPFFASGSLKDRIYKARPTKPFHKKYRRHTQRRPFSLEEVRLFGRQILEALNAVHEAGIPYGHLHARNVFIDQGVCRLTDLHNTIIGLPGYYRPYLIQLPKICMFPSIDVYCFGRILYEMTFGEGLDAPCIDSIPVECPAEIAPVLNLLITTEACFDKGMPTVKFLLQAPLFQSVQLNFECPAIRLTSRVVGICRGLAERYEKRLIEAEKAWQTSIEQEGVFYRPISPVLGRMKKSGSLQAMRKLFTLHPHKYRPSCLRIDGAGGVDAHVDSDSECSTSNADESTSTSSEANVNAKLLKTPPKESNDKMLPAKKSPSAPIAVPE